MSKQAGSIEWDTIVIGGGVEGSGTAYHLAKMGRKTLQLEQFTLPHSRGSSHGHSRITRKAYPKLFYSQMMIEAYQIWDELEKATGKKLFTKTGCVVIEKKGTGTEVKDVEKSLIDINSVPVMLNSESLKQRYPMMDFDSSYEAVLDVDGGVLAADKCLKAFQTEFVRLGGTLKDQEKVVQIRPQPDRVFVKTKHHIYQARSVVIAAGAWTNQMTDPLGLHLPLTPQRILVWYWKALQKGYDIADGFPTFIVPQGEDNEVWGLPSFEYPGLVKVCFHFGPNIDPNQRDLHKPTEGYNEAQMEHVIKFVQEHFKGLELRPSIAEPCIYTFTPDHDFILDKHPKWNNIIIGAGFSGHGFKLSPVVGKVLAELASFKQPSYCLDPFSIKRFNAPDPKL